MPASKEVMERVNKLLERAKHGEALTGSLERQHQYVAMLHSMTPPCWLCAKPVSYYEAVEDSYSLDDYRPDRKFTCPHCGTAMVHVVPFIAGPTPWYWGNPKIHEKDDEPT
jgi:hypothetical protein